jgi:phosphorylase kinase alpha/beta subunit
MAKAALEAIKGFNLFGDIEAQEGVVHVALNDIARSRLTLQSLLPRESNSKETDAALLSIIGYPAYAVENESLVNKTRSKIIDKLAGRYGCKRFLLDGHQSSIEDFTRLHYEASELRDFQDIESEWPLFFTYLLLDSLMRKDEEGVKMWKEKLEPLFVQKNGQKLLPELYIVPKENITAEKENPSSQERIPNENIPLVWAQSLYMLSEMILDGVLKVNDIDPIKRRKYIGKSCSTVPMVPVLAQNSKIKEELLKYSIKAQTIEELDSVFLMHASELAVIHSMLGKNEKLGLSGKKLLVARTITTSRLHLIKGKKVIFLPYYFDPKSFYFGFDNKLLVEHFKDSLSFLSKNWNQSGRPIVPFLVREDMLVEKSKDEVLALLQMIQTGRSDSVEVEYGKLEELLPFANLERIDNLPEYTITKTPLGREIEQNASCENTEGLDALQMYQNAINEHDWVKVREVADQCKKYDDRLEDALMDIVISQKRLAVGRAYSEKAILSKPCTTLEILDVIYEYCGNNRAERVLTQEIILHLGTLIYVEPELFSNMITLRTWDFIQLLVGHISRSKNISIGDAYEELLKYPPHYIYDNLRLILKSYSKEVSALKHLENIEISGVNDVSDLHIQSIKQEHVNVHDWYEWREKVARLGVLPDHLYSDVWYILQQCHGLVIGDKYSLQNRLGSEETLESTAGERGFELKVDTLLQGIEVPVYRQLNIELIESLVKFLRLNPDLYIESDLILDVLIGHAVRITWNKRHEEKNYKEQKGKAWSSFYYLSIYEVQESFIDAFIFLTKNSEEEEHVN